MENLCHCSANDIDERYTKALDIIIRYKEVDGGLIPLLHGIQELYGYLPEEILRRVSESLDIPMTEIYGVATFYHYFSLVPKGEHVIRVCLGTACYVKGSQLLINRLTQELGINVGETTKDNKFTLEATRCLGACGLAPVMTVDNKVYGKVTLDDIRRILDEYLIKEE